MYSQNNALMQNKVCPISYIQRQPGRSDALFLKKIFQFRIIQMKEFKKKDYVSCLSLCAPLPKHSLWLCLGLVFLFLSTAILCRLVPL